MCSCELLSNTYLHWWFTVFSVCHCHCYGLWIAFKHLSSLMIHSFWLKWATITMVVNCFQTLIFIDDSQFALIADARIPCCELLSNTYLHWWFTVLARFGIIIEGLWIAFKHLSSLMIHSSDDIGNLKGIVVNCFQTLIFIDDSQLGSGSHALACCCELLSNTYLHWWFTVEAVDKYIQEKLWIAFKHLSSLMIHSCHFEICHRGVVVNCFQTLIFIDDSQFLIWTIQ